MHTWQINFMIGFQIRFGSDISRNKSHKTIRDFPTKTNGTNGKSQPFDIS